MRGGKALVIVAGLLSLLTLTVISGGLQLPTGLGLVSEAQAGNRLKERARQARREAREARRQAREQAREAREKAREQAREARERAREQAREARKRAREQARETAKRQREQARKRRQRQQAKKRRGKAEETTQKANPSSDKTVKQSSKTVATTETQNKSQSSTSSSSDATGTDQTASGSKQKNDDASAQASNDGADRDDGRERNQDPAQAQEPAAAKVEGPPDTVEKLFRLWTKSKPVPKPKSKRRARRIPGTIEPVPFAKFSASEVLGINLSRGSVRRARQLGFKVRKGASVTSLDLTVLRLIAPSGFSARSARRLLKRKLPGDQFSLNSYYRLYRAARGKAQTGRAKIVQRQVAGGRKCKGDRCYGAAAINWRPKLRNCAKQVKIGVIDTDIDYNHPAFADRTPNIGKFVDGRRKAAPNWHGTGIMALLGGSAKTTTPGLIPGGNFYVGDVFFDDGNGNPVADSVGMVDALGWMAAWGVKVVNLSVAGPKDPLVEETIARLSKKGIIFVAAAGNNGPAAKPSYPAAYGDVIAVTAVNKKLRGYRYANRGHYIDVAAPGVDIWTAVPGQKEGYRSGTSFAAPYVTALVAALYGRTRQRSKKGLLAALTTKDLGRPGKDRVYGRGLVIAPKSCRPDRRPASGTARSGLTRN